MERGDGRVREGTVSGRGKVRRSEGGRAREIERGREKNGVFRGLVFWMLTSQNLCVCVCVCVCVGRGCLC